MYLWQHRVSLQTMAQILCCAATMPNLNSLRLHGLPPQGWLGSSETPLFRGRGAVQVARMAGTLLAWVTATGLRVYDTATHTRLAKIPAPKTPAGEAAAPASLLWLGIRELYVGWGRTVLVRWGGKGG